MIVLHRLQRSLLFHPWIKRVLTTISSAIILCIFIKDLYDYAQRFNGPSPLLITDDGAHHQFDFETEMGLNGDTNNLPKPPTNKNWAQRDISSTIRLGYGSPIGPKRTGIHSTFRGSWDMNGYEVSCQLWRQSKLNFVDPGWNPYLVGAGSYWFKKSLNCGQCLLIQNPKTNRSVVSQIVDYCPPPGCAEDQLDLHAAAAAFLSGSTSTDRYAVRNHFGLIVQPVECDWKSMKLNYYFSRGSGRFRWYLIIFGSTVPVEELTKVSMLDGAGRVLQEFTDISHDSYGRWIVQFDGKGGRGIYRLEMRGMQRIGGSKDANIITDVLHYNGLEETKTAGANNFPLYAPTTNIPQWPL